LSRRLPKIPDELSTQESTIAIVGAAVLAFAEPQYQIGPT
jgi:hypothetical protein